MFRKVLIWTGVALIALVLVIVIVVETTYSKNYDAEYPVREMSVELTPERIERGRYLAMGPAHCAHCHAPMKKMPQVEAGEEVDMTGGFGLEIPPGAFHAPNITSDKETGIGQFSDGELYRMMRYNINHRGEAAVDFMPFSNMSEEDIYSIIAYLRSSKPVHSPSRKTELSFLGKVAYTTGAVQPSLPDEDVPERVEPAVNARYGHYLAYAVANCRGCHTNRDVRSMKYIGEPYAGGLQFGPDSHTGDYVYVAPNLTPDPETGIMADWDEDQFVRRMKKGRLHATSPMPWGSFKQMSEDDLRAIYRYLKTLDPVKNEIPETARRVGSETAGFELQP